MLKKLIERITDSSWTQAPGVHVFVGDQSSSSCFAHAMRHALNQKDELFCSVIWAPLVQADMSALREKLAHTFLGASQIYWIAGSHLVPNRLKKAFYSFISSYTGPHTLIIDLDKDDAPLCIPSQHCVHTAIPEVIRGSELVACAKSFGYDSAVRKIEHFKAAFTYLTLSFNEAISLVMHIAYTPLKSPETLRDTLRSILPDHASLKDLSVSFLAQEWKKFFHLFRRVKGNYSEMFWVSYFSDLAWRAYFVCDAMSRRQTALAKRYSYRLPTSFVSRMWKKHDREKLYELYRSLYFFDVRAKNQTSFVVTDVLMHWRASQG